MTVLTEKLLPLVFSLSDLSKYLEAKGKLSSDTKKLITKARDQFLVTRVSESRWKNAIAIIDEAMCKGATDCAIGLLCTKEYSNIPQSCPNASKYRAELKALLGRYPDLRNNLELFGNIRHVYSSRTARGSNAKKFSAEVEGFLRTVQPNMALSHVKDWIRLLKGNMLESDAAHGWDWQDNAWYSKWGLPTPWAQGNRVGVEISSRECDPGDGWELYIRRLINTDGLVLPVDFSEVVLSDEDNKYFVLYNIHTGIMRMFVFFRVGDYPGIDRLIARIRCSRGLESNSFDTHGLFNHIGPICYTGSEIPNLQNNQLVHLADCVTRGWIVFDIPLSLEYLSSYGSGPFYLNTRLYAENTANISLEGNFQIKVPIPLDNQSFLSKIGTVFGAKRSIESQVGDVSKFGNKIVDLGNRIQNNSGDGSLLLQLGTALVSGSVPLAIAVGASQVVRSLLSLGEHSGGIRYSNYEGTMNLSGQIRDEGFRSYTAILLNDTDEALPFDRPYFFKKNPNHCLGLFQLTRSPQIIVHCHYGTRMSRPGGVRFSYRVTIDVEARIRELVIVNPYCDLVLDKILVQVVLQRPWTEHDDVGRRIDGTNIKHERDLIENKSVNYFPDSFEDPVPQRETRDWDGYYKREYIKHGIALKQGFVSTHRDCMVNNVFLRIMYVFRNALDNASEPIEVIAMYRPDVDWDERQINNLESSLPPLS